MTLSDMTNAMKKGQELPNAEAFKLTGVVVSVVSMLLTSLASYAFSHGWLQDQLSSNQIFELSGLLVSLVMGFLSWIQVATTKRIGIGEDQ